MKDLILLGRLHASPTLPHMVLEAWVVHGEATPTEGVDHAAPAYQRHG